MTVVYAFGISIAYLCYKDNNCSLLHLSSQAVKDTFKCVTTNVIVWGQHALHIYHIIAKSEGDTDKPTI